MRSLVVKSRSSAWPTAWPEGRRPASPAPWHARSASAMPARGSASGWRLRRRQRRSTRRASTLLSGVKYEPIPHRQQAGQHIDVSAVMAEGVATSVLAISAIVRAIGGMGQGPQCLCRAWASAHRPQPSVSGPICKVRGFNG